MTTAESQAAGIAHLIAIARQQQDGYADAPTEEIPLTPPCVQKVTE